MRNRVKDIIEKVLDREIVIERPKDKSHGHFATPVAFSMAKELRKSPMIIANDLAEKFSEEDSFSKVDAIKGYLNFHLSESFLNSYADSAIKSGDDFGKGSKEERILLEFVSANPTGPLHIGHSRGAIYGNTLLRMGRHLGYNIDAEYYINDAGRQIELLGVSIFIVAKDEVLGETVEYPEEYYRGEYIIDLAKSAVEKFGKEAFSSKEIIPQLSVWGKDEMMEVVKSNLKSVGIVFDNYVSEKSLYSDWEETLQKLQNGGGVYEEDGKKWLKSTEHGDEKDRVVVRDNGMPTYLAGDVIYHNNKFHRNYDKYINIWGADHHGYITRVKSAIEYLGYDSKRLEVLLTQMVALLKDGEPYKMSKRAGNFILLQDVVDEVSPDALKFTFSSKTPDTSLEFDVTELNKQDSSNPIFYVNYASARVHSLIRKSSFSLEEIQNEKLENLSNESRDILYTALQLPDAIEEAFESRQTQKLTDYLKNLASELHKFYNSQTVLGAENEKMILKALSVVALSIKVGLNQLGIIAKEEM